MQLLMQNTDSELINQYLAGEVNALKELVERYRKPLFGFILNMTRSADEADDIFQEVWLRVIRNIDRYKHKKFLSWLFRIAHNYMIDRFRKHKAILSLDAENDDGLSLKDRIPAPTTLPSTEISNAELMEKVRKNIAALPYEQKAVFLMRVEADLPFKEIAAIQKVSINTALARMHYALARLRNDLKNE